MKDEMLPAKRQDQSVAAVAAAATATTEVQSMMIFAMNNPRDEDEAYAAVMNICERPAFVGTDKPKAFYRFPRAGSSVEGVSAPLAREMARMWGNIRYGFDVFERTAEQITLKGWAHDLEKNVFSHSSITFSRLIQRKDKGGGKAKWVDPDPRDEIELIARNGSKAERTAILKLMPPFWRDEAIAKCKETMNKHSAGNLKTDKTKTIRNLVASFASENVTKPMLEKYLGKALVDMTPDDLTNLRGVYAALLDDSKTREDFFDLSGKAPATSKGKIKMEDLKPGEKDELNAPEAKAALDKSQAENEQREREPGEDDT